MHIAELEKMTLAELRRTGKELEIPAFTRMKKDDLVLRLLQANAERQGLELRGGILEIVEEGIGFLRAEHYLPGPNDIYVSQSQIRRFGLRTGDMVIGQVRAPKDTEKYLRPAAGGGGQRPRPGSGQTAAELRGPDADLPGAAL